jgi:hypothetical protein
MGGSELQGLSCQGNVKPSLLSVNVNLESPSLIGYVSVFGLCCLFFVEHYAGFTVPNGEHQIAHSQFISPRLRQ